MSDQSYRMEVRRNSDPIGDDESREQLMELVRDLGIDNEVEYLGRNRYLSGDPMPWIPLGTLAIASLAAFLQLLEYLENQEDATHADTRAPNGQAVHVQDIDGDVIVANGGEVISELNIGVTFAADRESFHEIMERHYGKEEWERQQQEALDEVLERHGYERE